jgi:hypothetical protein
MIEFAACDGVVITVNVFKDDIFLLRKLKSTNAGPIPSSFEMLSEVSLSRGWSMKVVSKWEVAV